MRRHRFRGRADARRLASPPSPCPQSRSITSGEGPTKTQVVLRACARERGILREEAVLGGRPHGHRDRGRHDARDADGALGCGGGRQADRLVGEPSVQASIRSGVHRDRLDRARGAHGHPGGVLPRFRRTREDMRRTLLKTGRTADRLELEQERPELHRGPRPRRGSRRRPSSSDLELVEELHRLEQQSLWPRRRRRPPRRTPGARLGGAVEDSDHRRLHACGARRILLREVELGYPDAPGGSARPGARLVRPADRDAHALVLDLDLADAGLLHDPDELANPFCTLRVDVAAESVASRECRWRIVVRSVSASSPNIASRTRVLPRGRDAFGGLADVLRARRSSSRGRVAGEELDRAADLRLIGAGGVPYAPETSWRNSSRTVPYRRADRTLRSAWEPRICPIGAASGGQPASSPIRTTSMSVSSRRSPAAWVRRRASSAATSPAGRSYSAANGDPRGERASGSSPMCSSTTSDASQRRGTSTPVSRSRPCRGPRATRRRCGAGRGERVHGRRDEVRADPSGDERVRERRAPAACSRGRRGGRSPRGGARRAPA